MSSTILRLLRRARLVALFWLVPATLLAHEIPNRVTVLAFVKPEPGRLRIVLRAPLEAMRDVNWPSKGLGYLDLPRAQPLARDAALQWIAGFIEVFEGGERLANGHLAGTRISLPSDRAFSSYETAL